MKGSRDQIEYHATRAMNELDRGLVASNMAAARAHLELSSLHLARVRALQDGSVQPKPPLVMG